MEGFGKELILDLHNCDPKTFTRKSIRKYFGDLCDLIDRVRENKTILTDPVEEEFIVAENYLEAAGIMLATKAGISVKSVRRPLHKTLVIKK